MGSWAWTSRLPNERAIVGVLACTPRLVAVKPALEVVPAMRPELVLHAAPPAPWEQLSPLLQTALAGAAEFEGLALEDVVLGAAQDFSSMAGGAGAITASTPVVVVEERGDRPSCLSFPDGGVRTHSDPRMTATRSSSDSAGYATKWHRRSMPRCTSSAGSTATRSWSRRCAAATSCTTGTPPRRRCSRSDSHRALRGARSRRRQERLFVFLRGNPQFFVAVSLAASKLMLDAGHSVEGSTLITGMGANGRDCGIRISGLGDEWFTAPAEVPDGVLLDGFARDDAGPSCGDSLLVECAGLGASVLPAAPALWPALGAGRERGTTRSSKAPARSRSRSTLVTACRCSEIAAHRLGSTLSASSRRGRDP